MSHKNNKNSKDNKKSGQKTNKELAEMKLNVSNSVGTNSESKKLGKNSGAGHFTSENPPTTH